MSHPTPHDQAGDPPSVEDRWHQLLTSCGASDDTAERIIRSVNAHPVLAFGDPSKDRIEQLTEQQLDDLELASPSRNISDPEWVRRQMKEILREGLADNIPGPVSLTTPHNIQVSPDTPEGGSTTPSAEGVPAQAASARTASSQANTTDSQPHPRHSEDPQMPEDTGHNTDDSEESSSQANPDTADSTETMTVAPEELGPAADGAAAAAPGAGAADPDTDQSTGGSQPATPSQDSVSIDDDLDVFIARQVRGRMEEDFLDEDAPEGILGLLQKAAEFGAYQHQQHLKMHLYGHLDENSRDLVFEQTIAEPMKEMIEELIEHQQ